MNRRELILGTIGLVATGAVAVRRHALPSSIAARFNPVLKSMMAGNHEWRRFRHSYVIGPAVDLRDCALSAVERDILQCYARLERADPAIAHRDAPAPFDLIVSDGDTEVVGGFERPSRLADVVRDLQARGLVTFVREDGDYPVSLHVLADQGRFVLSLHDRTLGEGEFREMFGALRAVWHEDRRA